MRTRTVPVTGPRRQDTKYSGYTLTVGNANANWYGYSGTHLHPRATNVTTLERSYNRLLGDQLIAVGAHKATIKDLMSSTSDIASLQVSDYLSLTAAVVVTYDFLLLIGCEVELVWKRPWSLMSTLYVVVRYLGLALAMSVFFLLRFSSSHTSTVWIHSGEASLT
ncbi:hypothetical protein K503DRAFT_548960 [Rhizopogon vinicolor AM-OR11-026]|uniref:DUF6533 domain-containing protein n=1 Tax=Rhizopogon vinicolor AM-OR11-026 TaxID=1314800 RepID=A0A1B7MKN5_9AGAM|nr:hypothetical protein K503DRAFT_548960 [Rhizopogon vinicolor AM-OR11-026]